MLYVVPACGVMACTVMVYVVMAYIAPICVVGGYKVMAYIVTTQSVAYQLTSTSTPSRGLAE